VTIIYADDTGAIQHIDGTASGGTPTPPTLPAGAIPLAKATIPQGTTAITQGMLTEFRQILVPVSAAASGTFTTLHVTGTGQFDSTVAIGTAADTSIAFLLRPTVIGATSQNASGINAQPTLRPGSGMSAYGVTSGPTIDTSAATVPVAAAIRGATFAKSGGNAVTAAYSGYFELPTAGNANYAGYFGGQVGVNQLAPTGTLHVLPSSTGTVGVVVQGLAGQSSALARFDGTTSVTNGTLSLFDKNGHFVQTVGTVPAASGLGTNVTSVTCAGGDQFGTITIVTSGAVTANATLATITFVTPFGVTPVQVSLIPATTATWGLAGAAQLTWSTLTATTWLLKAGSTGAGAGTYVYTYIVA
jgi:hypothetical protein